MVARCPSGVPPRGAGLPGRGPHFFPKKWGERRGRGECPPAPPSTGVHGGGGLYWACKNRVGIAARFPGNDATGAAAPRVARIGATLQALEVVALYQLGPPGRRRCHASERPGQSSQPSVGRDDPARLVQGRPAPLEGGTGRRGRRPLPPASRSAVGVGPLADPSFTGAPSMSGQPQAAPSGRGHDQICR